MIFSDWLSLILICILGAFSPGPSLIVIINCTLKHGRTSGIFASIGHGLGVFFYAFVSVLGLAIIIINSPKVFFTIQLMGSILLIWIGYKTIKDNNRKIFNNINQTIDSKKTTSFIDGFLIAILNPKIAAFFISLFSQFLTDNQEYFTSFLMASIAGIIDVSAYLIMVNLACTKYINTFLIEYSKFVQLIFGVFLVLLGLSLFYNFM